MGIGGALVAAVAFLGCATTAPNLRCVGGHIAKGCDTFADVPHNAPCEAVGYDPDRCCCCHDMVLWGDPGEPPRYPYGGSSE